MTFYCTFGHGQPHFGCFIKVEAANRDEAIKFMNERFGRWSMIYDSAEEAGVERWNLRELE